MLAQKGKYDDAIAQFDEAIKLDPSFEPAKENRDLTLKASHAPRER